ncbi:hypothetical protein [Gemmobacter serpentinus]|uniref:hypothetical protein n=1 Tax=Gemmobacter serpentinus TaxID=2652247 RepID=UPI00124CAAC9|nr:hypothetical protein [Gemmobacter serpentinus]
MSADILFGQLTDVFRIGLVIGLVYTMQRQRAATGALIPLLAGIVFIAVILPVTRQGQSGLPMATEIGLGLVSTAILTGIVLGVWTLYLRLRG